MKSAREAGIKLKSKAVCSPKGMSIVPVVVNSHLVFTGGLCGLFMLSCGPSMDPQKLNFLPTVGLVNR